ncbi:MAG: amidohydrolase family protein, partial [Pseudomonadota bacterium]
MTAITISGGLVADGTGGPLQQRDVHISDGKIVSKSADAATTIDATNRVVSPGFIDIHTHFDPQLCWDGLATPSIEHGVTTVVTGNCSLSLAPVRPGQSDKLVSMFQVIEDIKKPTFDAAVCGLADRLRFAGVSSAICGGSPACGQPCRQPTPLPTLTPTLM